jgi:DNA-directed RNA polymerase subunit RPC12/RpoP
MYECGTCGKQFYSGWEARDNHCRSTGHRPAEFICDTCDMYFGSEQSRLQHMDAKNHHFNDGHQSSKYTPKSSQESYEEWCCDMCNAYFDTEEECLDHEVEDHFYCADCERSFVCYEGVRMVRRRAASTGTNTQCPLPCFC